MFVVGGACGIDVCEVTINDVLEVTLTLELVRGSGDYSVTFSVAPVNDSTPSKVRIISAYFDGLASSAFALQSAFKIGDNASLSNGAFTQDVATYSFGNSVITLSNPNVSVSGFQLATLKAFVQVENDAVNKNGNKFDLHAVLHAGPKVNVTAVYSSTLVMLSNEVVCLLTCFPSHRNHRTESHGRVRSSALVE